MKGIWQWICECGVSNQVDHIECEACHERNPEFWNLSKPFEFKPFTLEDFEKAVDDIKANFYRHPNRRKPW